MKKYILFDHDGVLVDTEFWYFKAGERALADKGYCPECNLREHSLACPVLTLKVKSSAGGLT